MIVFTVQNCKFHCLNLDYTILLCDTVVSQTRRFGHTSLNTKVGHRLNQTITCFDKTLSRERSSTKIVLLASSIV